MLLVHWFRSFKLKHWIWWMFGVFLYNLSFSSPWKVGWWIIVVVAHIMKLPITSVEWIMPLLGGARRWSFMPKCRRLFIPEAELLRWNLSAVVTSPKNPMRNARTAVDTLGVHYIIGSRKLREVIKNKELEQVTNNILEYFPGKPESWRIYRVRVYKLWKLIYFHVRSLRSTLLSSKQNTPCISFITRWYYQVRQTFKF